MNSLGSEDAHTHAASVTVNSYGHAHTARCMH